MRAGRQANRSSAGCCGLPPPAQHCAVQHRQQTANSCGGFEFPPRPPPGPWFGPPEQFLLILLSLSGSCSVEILPASEVSPRLVTEAPPTRPPHAGSNLRGMHSSKNKRACSSRCSWNLTGSILLGSKALEDTLKDRWGVPRFSLPQSGVDLKLIYPFPEGGK